MKSASLLLLKSRTSDNVRMSPSSLPVVYLRAYRSGPRPTDLIVSVRLQLNAAGQRAVDHQVRAGGEARRGTGQKHDAAADLVRRRHAAGGVQRQRLGEQVGHVPFDIVPSAAFEISVAGSDGIHPD